MQAAPTANRQFHASDLCRLIGHAAYEARVLDVIRKFSEVGSALTSGVGGGDFEVVCLGHRALGPRSQRLYRTSAFATAAKMMIKTCRNH